jgi:glucosamine-6-phosphate deaminase
MVHGVLEVAVNELLTRFAVGELSVEVWPDADALGRAGARMVGKAVRDAVDRRGFARMVVATGNSQFPLIEALAEEDIPWEHVDVFHMDEYIGMDEQAPASFQRWIRERIELRFSPRSVDYIHGNAPDVDAEIDRYEAALRESAIDVVCMGVGENGHLAFNEPNACDFEDPRWVRRIELQPRSRRQQVNEGHFPDYAAVPGSAISLTIPALLSAETTIVSAPELRKAEAVRTALEAEVSTDCPATVLRRKPKAVLLLDPQSASLIPA